MLPSLRSPCSPSVSLSCMRSTSWGAADSAADSAREGLAEAGLEAADSVRAASEAADSEGVADSETAVADLAGWAAPEGAAAAEVDWVV